MNTPGYGVSTILPTSYGHGVSTNGMPPAIDTRVTVGAPLSMKPPTFSPNPMPLIDRITPRSVNATETLTTVKTKLTTIGATKAVAAIDNILANAHSIRMRILPTDPGKIKPPYRY